MESFFNKSKTKLVWYPQNKKGNSYKLPAKVKEIGTKAFSYNKNIKRITLSSVKKVDFGVFLNCNLQKVTIPRRVTSIANYSFGFRQSGVKPIYGMIQNKKFTIYCKKTSAAYKYAKKNTIQYKFY